jgi:quinoprotein glucose dehydrogenase
MNISSAARLAWMSLLLSTQWVSAQNMDWPNVGNDKGGMRYALLRQINTKNVSSLEVAWTYHTGDSGSGNSTTIECTPIVIDGVMYVTTAKTKVVALAAETGREKWRFDPYGPGITYNPIRASGGVNRGVAYWSDRRPGGQRRIFLGASDARLISLDAKTGLPDPSFGQGGSVDLRAGIEWDVSQINYGPTSAPAVFENLVVVGFSNAEGQPNAPGDVRAFDARTGKEVWRFHTVPRPSEPFHETWEGDSWVKRGGANAWGGFTIDERRGIVFCGTGSCSNDYYGGDRKGDNLFANCTLALDARTGKRLWHFQTIHHDMWDYDTPCPPVLVTVKRGGRTIDAVAQLTKVGMCFLFERETGKPVYDIVERPVPLSEVPGEKSSPTQPFPVKPPPYAPQGFHDTEVSDISDEARTEILTKIKDMRRGAMYTPPSLEGTVVAPGWHGGSTWAGGAFDPTNGTLYFNSNNAPVVFKVGKRGPGPLDYSPVSLGYLRDKNGYLGSKPPWGLVNAIDLSKGDFAWRSVLGEYAELKAKGVPATGTENFGGVIVTAGGLVFIGGSTDAMFHAFDKKTGKLLWETKLPAGGYAMPCTYMVNGRQYVVIAAGGGGKLGTKSGDSFVAFALPKGSRTQPVGLDLSYD